jgi:ketosteroid isomerase-like protein
MSSALHSCRTITVALALVAVVSCRGAEEPALTDAHRAAIADTLKRMIVSAYDLTRPGDAVARLMSLYPDSGTIISASGGRVTTSRRELEEEIRAFWDNVGRNMRDPKWTWGEMHVDVMSPSSAVVTSTYRVPHLTPRGEPHVIAGAWTAAFERRRGRWVIVQEHLSDLPAAQAMAMRGDSTASPVMPAMPGMPGTHAPASTPPATRRK